MEVKVAIVRIKNFFHQSGFPFPFFTPQQYIERTGPILITLQEDLSKRPFFTCSYALKVAIVRIKNFLHQSVFPFPFPSFTPQQYIERTGPILSRRQEGLSQR